MSFSLEKDTYWMSQVIYVQIIFLIVPPSLLMASLLSLSVMADPMKTDWGRVSMEGSITDTACAIDPGSLEQTIDMAIFPIGQLVQNGIGDEHPFAIRLLDCTIVHPDPDKSNQQHFVVTFDGAADGNNFAVNGDAEEWQCKSLMIKAMFRIPGGITGDQYYPC